MKTARSFNPDFNYNASNETIGNPKENNETAEEATERMLRETEEFVKNQMSKEEIQQQIKENDAMWNTRNISSWANNLLHRQQQQTSSGNDNDENEEEMKKDDETDLLFHQHHSYYNNKNNKEVSEFRVSSLANRYQTLLVPLCQELVHRSLRISLENTNGLLRSVTDALNSACLLQHPKAAVDFQDRLLDMIFISPSSSSSSSTSSTDRFIVKTKPTTRLSSCSLIWRNFWCSELQGQHSRFLNVTLDFSSTLYNKIASMSASSQQQNQQQQQTLSPLMILQFARLNPHFGNLTMGNATNNNNSNTDSNIQIIKQQFFENLFPDRCIDRYGRVMFALLTWTIIDRMCVQLWRVATNRQQNSNMMMMKMTRRTYFEEGENEDDENQEKDNLETNSLKVSAALWEFVTISRGVLTSLRENIWHGVSVAFRKYSEKVSTNTSSDNDGLHKNDFNDFKNSLDELLNETHEACCLTEDQKEIRKTISILMRIIEQVYSAIILVGGGSSSSSGMMMMNALSRIPPSVLQQQTEQFILATRTLESQVVVSSAGINSGSSSSSSSIFNVLAGIRAALPRNHSSS